MKRKVLPASRQSEAFPAPSSPDFRAHLQAELARRCRQNPRYSLRAFAQQLQLEPAALSKLLKGTRRFSRPMFEHLADRLGLRPEEWKRLAPGKLTRKRVGEPAGTPAVSPYRSLEVDQFHMISDWYHFAILELTHTSGFRPEPRWIARSLGITVNEVNVALERLRNLEMLQVDEKSGRWTDRSGAVTTASNAFTNAAFRRLQRQVLEMGADALESVPFDERDQSSMTMAIDSSLLPEARERIKRFRRELCEFLKSGPRKDRVYQLGVSLYPVSRARPSGETTVTEPNEKEGDRV